MRSKIESGPSRGILFGTGTLPERASLGTIVLCRQKDVADIFGNSPEIVRKHYAKWSPARQDRINRLMQPRNLAHRWYTKKDTAIN